ncbi:DUF192 domain-containing protein [Aliikangiella sp. IMCC44632]
MECKLTKRVAFINGQPVIDELFIASSWWQRMRGLIGRDELTNRQGLLISSCNSVHMFGMSYALDIIYLCNQNKIKKIVKELRPWQVSFCSGAVVAIELKAKVSEKLGIKIGDKFEWSVHE